MLNMMGKKIFTILPSKFYLSKLGHMQSFKTICIKLQEEFGKQDTPIY